MERPSWKQLFCHMSQAQSGIRLLIGFVQLTDVPKATGTDYGWKCGASAVAPYPTSQSDLLMDSGPDERCVQLLRGSSEGCGSGMQERAILIVACRVLGACQTGWRVWPGNALENGGHATLASSDQQPTFSNSRIRSSTVTKVHDIIHASARQLIKPILAKLAQ